MPVKVAPSILSANFARLGEEVKAIEKAGADWVHVDVMDGHFVPNLTIGAPVVKCLRPETKLPLDVHLMIESPENYVEEFAKAGADYITFHIEATRNPKALIERIHELGVKAGITLRPGTAIGDILPYLSYVQLVLVMTVEPGFGGQSFMMSQIEKIQTLRQQIDQNKYDCVIEVDGGVNEQTLQYCKGADVVVAGSYVFKNDYAKAIQTLKQL